MSESCHKVIKDPTEISSTTAMFIPKKNCTNTDAVYTQMIKKYLGSLTSLIIFESIPFILISATKIIPPDEIISMKKRIKKVNMRSKK